MTLFKLMALMSKFAFQDPQVLGRDFFSLLNDHALFLLPGSADTAIIFEMSKKSTIPAETIHVYFHNAHHGDVDERNIPNSEPLGASWDLGYAFVDLFSGQWERTRNTFDVRRAIFAQCLPAYYFRFSFEWHILWR
jgi:hypothetical protein